MPTTTRAGTGIKPNTTRATGTSRGGSAGSKSSSSGSTSSTTRSTQKKRVKMAFAPDSGTGTPK
jgi:hypothetical protein